MLVSVAEPPTVSIEISPYLENGPLYTYLSEPSGTSGDQLLRREHCVGGMPLTNHTTLSFCTICSSNT